MPIATNLGRDLAPNAAQAFNVSATHGFCQLPPDVTFLLTFRCAATAFNQQRRFAQMINKVFDL